MMGSCATWPPKNKGRGLLMLIKDTIPFVDNIAALPQSADPHLEQQGITITMPNRKQLHIHNIYIPPRSSCSADINASNENLLSNKEMSLIVGDINAHLSRWNTNINEDESGEQIAEHTILIECVAGQLRPTSVWIPLTSH